MMNLGLIFVKKSVKEMETTLSMNLFVEIFLILQKSGMHG